jgi:hypothetical protein
MSYASPDPCRACGEVDDQRGCDTEQVREQVENAEASHDPHDGGVQQQGGQGGQVELQKPRDRRSPRTEGPQLVEHVVVGDGHLGRQDGRDEKRHPRRAVEQEQEEAVDPDADEANDEEPPQSNRAECRRCLAYARHRLVQVTVHRNTGFEGQVVTPQWCAHQAARYLHHGN